MLVDVHLKARIVDVVCVTAIVYARAKMAERVHARLLVGIYWPLGSCRILVFIVVCDVHLRAGSVCLKRFPIT